MNTSSDALAGLTIGEPTTVRNLTVFPLVGDLREAKYQLLAHALNQGSVTISEISESGAVPRVRLDNRGGMPVLLLDGEHLIGCKQNRIVNTTVLVPARSEVSLPVSCVEHGRWNFSSSHFDSSSRGTFAELRAAKTAQVTRNLHRSASHVADQSAIWDGIAAKADRMGSTSASGAMSGIFERREADLKAYMREIGSATGQRGAIFVIGGRVVGLEVLDAQSTWAACFSKILSGFALDAVDHQERDSALASKSAAEAFVERLAASRETRFDGVGLGHEVRFEGGDLAGLALVVDRTVVHLCAFDIERDAAHWLHERQDRVLRRSARFERGDHGGA